MIYFNAEIIVMDAKPSAKAMTHIMACVKENKCLCGCGKPMLKLGLAQNCYYRWRSLRMKLATKAKRAAYDAKLIRIGRLLPGSMIVQLRRRSVFDSVASEIGE